MEKSRKFVVHISFEVETRTPVAASSVRKLIEAEWNLRGDGYPDRINGFHNTKWIKEAVYSSAPSCTVVSDVAS